MYPSATVLRDSDDKLPVHYARSAEAKVMLQRATPQVEKAGISSSFARFSVTEEVGKGSEQGAGKELENEAGRDGVESLSEMQAAAEARYHESHSKDTGYP